MSATDPEILAKLKELEFLMESSHALNATLNVDQLLGVIMRIVREAVDADSVSLLLLDEDETNLVFELARGRRDQRVRGLKVPVGEGIVGWVARHRRPLVVEDTAKDPRYSHRLEKVLGVRPRSVMAVPLMRRGELVGVLDAVDRKDGSPFGKDDVRLVMALGEHIAMAVGNARLYEEAERRRQEYLLLARVTADLAGSLTTDQVLRGVLKNLRVLIPFDAAAVFLLDRNKRTITSLLHRGYPGGAAEKIRVKTDEGLVGLSARRRRGIIVDDVRTHPRYVEARPGTKSEMIAPMMSAGRVIGVFNLESDRLAAYRPRQLRLLEAFATQAAVAIERAGLYEEQRVKREIEDELRVARTVQEFFAPKRSREFGNFRVAGLNVPSLEVSGDYYDYFPAQGRLVAFAIADVAGKGVPAALIISGFRAILRTVAPYLTSARQVAVRANQILLETVRPQDFITAFIGVLDPETGTLSYCNAGHNPPVLMSPDGSHRRLERGGTVLGILPGAPYEEGRLRLGDDTLLCYTDGATEARNAADDEYGEVRMIDALRELRGSSPYQVVRGLHGALKEFVGDHVQTDDVTYLAIRHRDADR